MTNEKYVKYVTELIVSSPSRELEMEINRRIAEFTRGMEDARLGRCTTERRFVTTPLRRQEISMPKEERRLKVLKFKKDLFEFLADATENVIDRLGKVRIRLHGMQSEAANQYYTYNYKASRGL